ncbi:RING-type domain-containing protein, partial [Aphis craccivora]
MDHEGFHYNCTKTTREGKRYYICATPNVYCKGTAIMLENGTVITKKPHTHEGNDIGSINIDLKKQFRSVLVERAKNETKPLKSIYDEESIRNPNAAVLYAWPSAESSMRQARKQHVPPLPSTLRELGQYLDLNINKYQCSNQPFYQEWIVDRDGKFNVMFACHDLINSVVHEGGTELHADGTFKVVPSNPHCRQLFIIHLILQNHSIPICFVLMEAKTEASYKKVLERFKMKFPSVRPSTIMIDFETGLRNAFTAIYPEANIFSCWFHYIQSLQKNIKKLGYTRYVKENMAAKMCVKMTAALALLPEHQIEMGFEDIKMYAQANNVQLPRKGPECFTVHGQPRRTNNNVESFHSSLKQTFQVLHPNLWTFLEHLNNITIKQHTIVQQLSRGVPTTRSTKFKYILNSVRIRNSTDLLTTGVITIKEFLIQCSHVADSYLERELSWEDEAQSSDEEVPIMYPRQNAILPVEDNPAIEDSVDIIEPPIDRNLIPVDQIIQEPEVNIVEDYDERDFIIPEDQEMGIWQQLFMDGSEEDEVPFVQVPNNLYELYPPVDEENICTVCRVAQRTHALVPCGHRVLCVDCMTQLEAQRCPLCNIEFVMALRI